MENRVGRERQAGSWDSLSTPAAAKSYYLRVLKLDSGNSRRNLRVMHTMAAALDHLALGRPRQAADILMQRLKVLELASATGSWECATFSELFDAEEATLADTEESFMVAKESELAMKLSVRGSPSGRNPSWSAWQEGWTGAGGKSSLWNHPPAEPWSKGKAPWHKSNGKGKGGKKGKDGKGKEGGRGKHQDYTCPQLVRFLSLCRRKAISDMSCTLPQLPLIRLGFLLWMFGGCPFDHRALPPRCPHAGS